MEQKNVKRTIENISSNLHFPNKKIFFQKKKLSDVDLDIDTSSEFIADSDDDDDCYFIADSNSGDSGSEDSDDLNSTDSNSTDSNSNTETNTKTNTETNTDNNLSTNENIKSKNVKYYDSSDSSDSENIMIVSNPKKFALDLLKKTKRHNSTDNPESILTKFNKKINKMLIRYKEYSKNPSAYRKLREYKKNLDECANLVNELHKNIKHYKIIFNFDLFYKKYKKSKNQIEKQNFEKLETILKLNDENKPDLDKQFKKLYEYYNKTHNGLEYFKNLDDKTKLEYINKLKKIGTENNPDDQRPNYIKVLDMDISDTNKTEILQKISELENSSKSGTVDTKLKNWINKIMKVPFGTYIKPPVSKTDPVDKIQDYLNKVRNDLNDKIYGHQDSKERLIKILAHSITNPDESGNIFALEGPPGVGKTSLVQDGIAKALGYPFAFINLGGSTNACLLEGHDFTYEGSNHGKIVEILQQSKCMNPVIYFDELDKVSETPNGEEIINILIHLTDQTQNSHFNDRYFGGIDFDLSKAIIIFSFNDIEKISRILIDRIKIIKVGAYKLTDKLSIANNYLIPKLIEQIGMDNFVVNFDDNIIEYLIENYTFEGGVRKLKEIIKDIILEINLRRLEDNKIMGKQILFPLTITEEMIEKDFLKNKEKIEHLKINNNPMIGQVNGLWASSYGVGGLIPIESCWIPSTDKLQLELTGQLGDVMKESMSIARSIAWRILPNKIKSNLNKRWKNTVDFGIHIHCPDGSTPKDGPSAGGAITTCLISLLTNTKVNNQIAMTGEINLKGNITGIGGLEEKLFGAKKAGVKLVLCPRENSKDLDVIIKKFPNLLDKNFKVKLIDNIWEILKEVINEPIEWVKFN